MARAVGGIDPDYELESGETVNVETPPSVAGRIKDECKKCEARIASAIAELYEQTGLTVKAIRVDRPGRVTINAAVGASTTVELSTSNTSMISRIVASEARRPRSE